MNDDRRYWDKHAKNYDRSMKLLGGPIPTMVAMVKEASRGCERVLEVAAGTGLVTSALSKSAQQVIATDYSPAMVAELTKRMRDAGLDNVDCRQADIYQLPFENGVFDAVVAANVLHLVPDLPGALRALVRVVSPGGQLILPCFCHDETWPSWLMSRMLALTGFPGQRRFTTASLTQAVEASGIRVTHVQTLPGLLPIGYIQGTRLDVDGDMNRQPV